jgi:ABC-type microcin C transport system permease subunit YejB
MSTVNLNILYRWNSLSLSLALQPSLGLGLLHANLFQSFTPIPFSSLSTSSIYLLLGLPRVLSPRSGSNVDFLTGSLALIHATCPAHLSLANLIHFKTSGSAYSWCTILHCTSSSTDQCGGWDQKSFLGLSFQKLLTVACASLLTPSILLHM